MEGIRIILWLTILQLFPVTAVVPSNIPETITTSATVRQELIEHYFHCGFTYMEIVLLLFVINGIKLSVRHLKRILKSLSLTRQTAYTPHEIVVEYISKEIETSGQCIGYRSMWRRLVNDHKLKVPRDKVLTLMRQIDPVGIQLRKIHRLRRRKYRAKGPNYMWHVDGYDKLKQFGFCIHGAMDGYSRRILWLEVSQSNNDPHVIAMYYLETLNTLGIVPRMLRCDNGTENSILAVLQPFFRNNHTDSMAGLNSFIYGRSVSNQRIYAWWGTLRRQGVQWWIRLFKDLKDENEYAELNPVHVECLKFCFTRVIQAELDRVAAQCNLHFIRSQKNAETPVGKPDLIYFIPEVFGGYHFGKAVDKEDVSVCSELYGSRRKICCQEFEDLAIFLKPDLQIPTNADDALMLYKELLVLVEENTE